MPVLPKFKIIWTGVVVLFTVIRTLAQAPSVQWQKNLGGTRADRPGSIIQTFDGGYVIAGTTNSNDGDVGGNHSAADDIWVVKLNAAGTIQWQKCYGGSLSESVYVLYSDKSVQQTSDSGFIVIGTTSSSSSGDVGVGKGNADMWILKLDKAGTIQWQNCYGGSNADGGYSVRQTDDGGYIALGYTTSNDGDVSGNHGGGGDIWVVKLNAAGVIQWQKCYGGSQQETGGSVIQTSDGGFIFVGDSRSNDGDVSGNKGNIDLWIVKTDRTGTIEWNKTYGGSDNDQAGSIRQIRDGYIVVGSGYSADGDISRSRGNGLVWVLKLDLLGGLVWEKSYGAGGSNESGRSIELTKDKGYIVCGYTSAASGDVSRVNGKQDVWLFKLDSSGVLLWERSLGGSEEELFPNAIPTSDGGFAVCSESRSANGDLTTNYGMEDIWVTRLYPDHDMPHLSYLHPARGGNTGDVTVNIYGGGFAGMARVKLIRGTDTISAPDSIVVPVHKGYLMATFDLRGANPALYDVLVDFPALDTTFTITNGFEVEAGQPKVLWSNIVAAPNVRTNTWETITLVYGNKSNVNATGVPVFFALPEHVEVKFPFTFKTPDTTYVDIDSLFDYVVVDSLYGNQGRFKVYILYVPFIPAHGTKGIPIQIRTSSPQPVTVKTWILNPLFGSPLKRYLGDCMDGLLMESLGYIPFFGCGFTVSQQIIKYGADIYYDNAEFTKGYIGNFIWDLSATTLGCLTGSLQGGYRIAELLAKEFVTSVGFSRAAIEHCSALPDPNGAPFELTIQPVGSMDPNDKLGPAGYNNSPYYNATGVYNYQIRFENADTATAPAQHVVILDTLDTRVFDLTTFQLGFLTIGDTLVSFSPFRSDDSLLIDLSGRGIRAVVDVKATLDRVHGILRWDFQALDPVTRQPITDPLGGFLPPNRNAPEGEGSVFFSIRLKENLPSGTVISNKAYIYFDANPPVITPDWINKLDVIAPVSAVKPLPAYTTDSIFSVSWEGTDVGSGLLHYSISYKVNNGDYQPWLSNTPQTSAIFTARPGNTYSFYSVARDTALNTEAVPSIPDAVTRVGIRTDVLPGSASGIGVAIFPNPVNRSFHVGITGPQVSTYNISMADITGRTVMQRQLDKGASSLEIHTQSLENGLYYVIISDAHGELCAIRKIVVVK